MIGERVRVHLNLQRGDFSITQQGRVVASAHDVTLKDVRFIVSETTRQRVIRHTRRRVHAWAEGVLVSVDTKPDTTGMRGITYNPYRAATFTTFDGEPVTRAGEVTFVDRFGWSR